MTPDQLSTLIDALRGAVNQATFDVECAEIEFFGNFGKPHCQSISSTEFRKFYLREKDRPVRLSAKVHVPSEEIESLIEALKFTLDEFINLQKATIGHSFPIDGEFYIKTKPLKNGLYDRKSVSSLKRFAHALVQAAAVRGVEETADLLISWKRGQPVKLCIRTIMSGLPLNTSLTLQQGVQIEPLPLAIEDLPRLPIIGDIEPYKYRGLSIVSIKLSAKSAFFHPDELDNSDVHCNLHDTVNFKFLCEALSLKANDIISTGFFWREFQDAGPFCLTQFERRDLNDGNQLRSRSWKSESVDFQNEIYKVTPRDDDQPLNLDEREISKIINKLSRADKKLRIAFARWYRSKRTDSSLEDNYIDLRIALEALYLDRFNENYAPEMRFRLSLFGACHLAENPEDRRSILETLRNAYDIGSKVIHGGTVFEEPHGDQYRKEREEFVKAQDLCREGILKFIHEDSPKDWYDLVFGSPAQPAPLLDIPVEDSTPASQQNPQLVSISVEGFSHDRKKIELKLKFQGIQDKSVLIPSSVVHELSKVLRGKE